MEIIDGQVYEIIKKGNGTIKRLIGQELYIKLSISKEKILADGIDESIIDVTIYDYENNVKTTFQNDIIFEIEGTAKIVKAINGKATITITSDAPGEIRLIVNADKVKGEEGVIYAV